MLIKNFNEISSKNIKTFSCKDNKIKKYLEKNNILPIYYNQSKKQWEYILCKELEDILNNKCKGGILID